MLTSKIYAGIVTFNPEIIRLKQNIDAISPQLKDCLLYTSDAADAESSV